MRTPATGPAFAAIALTFFGIQILCGGCSSGVQPGGSEPDAPPVATGAGSGHSSPEERTIYVEYQPVRDEMLPLIERVRDKYGIVGLSVAVVDHGQVVWGEGFGYADREAGINATADTVYRVGSVAKPFTATAVMQLEQRGVVDIDQPLSLYLPEFSIRSRFNTTAEPITARSVLIHHAGLPTDLGKGMWSHQRFTEVAGKLAEEYAAFPPNLVFSYSNVGYSLLGHMVEENAGQPFESYMREAVFEPLNMEHSGYHETPEIMPLLAQGYDKDGSKGGRLPIRDLPAYGLLSSANDLSAFMAGMMDHSVHGDDGFIDHATATEMLRVQNGDIELDLQIHNGIGWVLEYGSIPRAGYVARHGGTTLLFSAEMVMLPEHELGVVVLSNTGGTRRVVSHLAEDILTLILKRRDDTEPYDGIMELAAWEVHEREIQTIPMVGSYATGMGLVAIRPKSDKLCACVADATLDLIPMPNGWYGVNPQSVDSLPLKQKALAKLHFATRTIDGRDVIIAERDGKEVLLGEKFEPQSVPQAWQDRVGPYELLNPDPAFPLKNPTVWYKDGNLGMSYRMPLLADATISVPLRPISDSEAVILGLGRTRGETLRAFKEGGEEHLRYSGYIGRKR
jgi:CubicO group peptidase (beta-lactamase class C family)